jgi:hypothetical protein
MTRIEAMNAVIRKQLDSLGLSQWRVSDRSDFSPVAGETTCVLQNPVQRREITVRLPAAWFGDQTLHPSIGVLIKRAIAAAIIALICSAGWTAYTLKSQKRLKIARRHLPVRMFHLTSSHPAGDHRGPSTSSQLAEIGRG